MIEFESILKPCSVEFVNECMSRKSALESASNILSRQNGDLDARDLLEQLTAREELGSTALDDSGVAIPHCRNDQCRFPAAALLRVAPDVQFGPGEYVKLIMALVVPTQETSSHLEILRTVALVCSQKANMVQLLDAASSSELHATFMQLVREASAA